MIVVDVPLDKPAHLAHTCKEVQAREGVPTTKNTTRRQYKSTQDESKTASERKTDESQETLMVRRGARTVEPRLPLSTAPRGDSDPIAQHETIQCQETLAKIVARTIDRSINLRCMQARRAATKPPPLTPPTSTTMALFLAILEDRTAQTHMGVWGD